MNLCIYKKHASERFFNKSSFATSEIMDWVLPQSKHGLELSTQIDVSV